MLRHVSAVHSGAVNMQAAAKERKRVQDPPAKVKMEGCCSEELAAGSLGWSPPSGLSSRGEPEYGSITPIISIHFNELAGGDLQIERAFPMAVPQQEQTCSAGGLCQGCTCLRAVAIWHRGTGGWLAGRAADALQQRRGCGPRLRLYTLQA